MKKFLLSACGWIILLNLQTMLPAETELMIALPLPREAQIKIIRDIGITLGIQSNKNIREAIDFEKLPDTLTITKGNKTITIPKQRLLTNDNLTPHIRLATVKIPSEDRIDTLHCKLHGMQGIRQIKDIRTGTGLRLFEKTDIAYIGIQVIDTDVIKALQEKVFEALQNID